MKNALLQVLLERATSECMGVQQVDQRALMISVITECINACGSDFGSKLIKQHWGIPE